MIIILIGIDSSNSNSKANRCMYLSLQTDYQALVCISLISVLMSVNTSGWKDSCITDCASEENNVSLLEPPF